MKKTFAGGREKLCFSFILLLLGFAAAQVSAQTAAPKRMVVLSRYTESVKAAEKQFELKYGAGNYSG